MSRSLAGIAIAALAIAFVPSVGIAGDTFRVLYNFKGESDGAIPYAGVVRDKAGNLYGTTQEGGCGGCGPGYGVVFKLTPHGSEKLLHVFTGGSDGAYPLGDLLLDSSTGDLYGTTYEAGNLKCAGPLTGCGTIFKISSGGKFTTLYRFSGGADGSSPSDRLVRDEQGNFYGTARYGAAQRGTVFKFTTDGKLQTLHSFVKGEGGCPIARLRWDWAGNLYGTAPGDCFGDPSILFRLAPDGTFTKLLGGGDGASPYGGVAKDTDNNLYGTGGGGDPVCGCGLIFRLTPNGTETVLHAFAEGGVPLGTLLRARGGAYYGTTEREHTSGSIFRITRGGRFETIHYFDQGKDGGNPTSSLIEDENGNLYGTGNNGGTYGYGTVFTLKE